MATVTNTNIENLAEAWKPRYVNAIRNKTYSSYFTTRQYESGDATVVHRKTLTVPVNISNNQPGAIHKPKRAVDSDETMTIDRGKTASFMEHPVETKSESRGNSDVTLKRVNDTIDTLVSYTDNDHLRQKITDAIPNPDRSASYDFAALTTSKTTDDRRFIFQNFLRSNKDFLAEYNDNQLDGGCMIFLDNGLFSQIMSHVEIRETILGDELIQNSMMSKGGSQAKTGEYIMPCNSLASEFSITLARAPRNGDVLTLSPQYGVALTYVTALSGADNEVLIGATANGNAASTNTINFLKASNGSDATSTYSRKSFFVDRKTRNGDGIIFTGTSAANAAKIDGVAYGTSRLIISMAASNGNDITAAGLTGTATTQDIKTIVTTNDSLSSAILENLIYEEKQVDSGSQGGITRDRAHLFSNYYGYKTFVDQKDRAFEITYKAISPSATY